VKSPSLLILLHSAKSVRGDRPFRLQPVILSCSFRWSIIYWGWALWVKPSRDKAHIINTRHIAMREKARF